jgi:hypothetical protein
MATKQTTKVIGAMTVGNPIGNMQPKTIAAVILVAVMGVLWVRVLFRSGGAEAALADTSPVAVDSTQQADTDSEIQIRPVSLTEIPGRHDTIAADFFRADRCSAWAPKPVAADPVVKPAEDKSAVVVNELIKAIVLEAIIKDAQGNPEKACINGTLVKAGSVLQVPVRNEMKSVRVTAVQPGRVQLSWQDRSIDIEMPDQRVN